MTRVRVSEDLPDFSRPPEDRVEQEPCRVCGSTGVDCDESCCCRRCGSGVTPAAVVAFLVFFAIWYLTGVITHAR